MMALLLRFGYIFFCSGQVYHEIEVLLKTTQNQSWCRWCWNCVRCWRSQNVPRKLTKIVIPYQLYLSEYELAEEHAKHQHEFLAEIKTSTPHYFLALAVVITFQSIVSIADAYYIKKIVEI